jgi:hypothetical protein
MVHVLVAISKKVTTRLSSWIRWIRVKTLASVSIIVLLHLHPRQEKKKKIAVRMTVRASMTRFAAQMEQKNTTASAI